VRLRRWLAVSILAALACASPAAYAHQSSVSYSKVHIGDDARVEYVLQLSTRDLYEALALDRDRDATDDEIERGQERLFSYVLALIRIGADGGASCPTRPGPLRILVQNDRFAELSFSASCPAASSSITVDYGLFFDLDRGHIGMLQASYQGKTVTRELRRGLSRFAWNLGEARPSSLSHLDYISKGVEHIFTGYDHIAFLCGLLLFAAIVATGPGAWEARGLKRGSLYALRIVTAFTVAHSLTLIAAALGLFDLPSRLVESAIAASIVYVAAENLWVREAKHRWVLAFAFGLIHGLGFASMLRPLLPPRDVVVPLLEFNLGVELGQLCIVLVLYPVLHVYAQRDATRYRRVALVGGSVATGLLGAVWLAERVLDISLMP
jgi:hypothetical protein